MTTASSPSGFRHSRFGFGLRIILIVLVILAATQALGTYLSILSFEKIYIRTAASKYEILGKSLKRKIEQSLKLGKSLEHFVGMGRLAAPLYQQLPDLDEIFIANSDGKRTFSSGRVQVIMAKSLSDLDDSSGELISGQYRMPDTGSIDHLFDWQATGSILRPHDGRYYVMLPIDSGSGKPKAILGIVFNRSTLEARKMEMLRSARYKLMVSIIFTAVLVGLLVRHLFIKPASRFMHIVSDNLFKENRPAPSVGAPIPEELLEINLNIADYVNQVNTFKRETTEILNQLSLAAPQESTTLAHIRQMQHILFQKSDETANAQA